MTQALLGQAQHWRIAPQLPNAKGELEAVAAAAPRAAATVADR
jgi:hypothetical protein